MAIATFVGMVELEDVEADAGGQGIAVADEEDEGGIAVVGTT